MAGLPSIRSTRGVPATVVVFVIGVTAGCVPTQLLRVPEGATIVDARTRTEFGMNHLACAKSLPWYDADGADQVREALPDKGRPVVVYCLSGHRSVTAKRRLEAQGYTDVHDGASMMSLQRLIERTARDTGCSAIEPVAR